MDIHCALDPCAFVFAKQIRGVTSVNVDDLLGGGDEVLQRTILDVKRQFDFGAWDV